MNVNATRTSLVFGGNSGIGAVISKNLESRGDKVYTASRSSSNNRNHLVYDLLDPKENDIFGSVDYLVFSQRYRGNHAKDEHDLMIQAPINFLSVNEQMQENLSSIVFLGSTAGQRFIQEQDCHYHVTRAGIESMARYLAVELGSKNICVNCVLTTTLIKPENANFFKASSKARADIEMITPLGRIGNAIDVANAVEFFLSTKSSFITGQSIMVDGGAGVVSPETVAKLVSKT
jgi:3-oxoacyl-[acyl-carrier protein] reductase